MTVEAALLPAEAPLIAVEAPDMPVEAMDHLEHSSYMYLRDPPETCIATIEPALSSTCIYVAIGRYRWFAWAIVVRICVSVLMVHGR